MDYLRHDNVVKLLKKKTVKVKPLQSIIRFKQVLWYRTADTKSLCTSI